MSHEVIAPDYKVPADQVRRPGEFDCVAHQVVVGTPSGDKVGVPYTCPRREGCLTCPVGVYAAKHGVTPELASTGTLSDKVNAGVTFNYMVHVAHIPKDKLQGTVVAGHTMDDFHI